MLQILVIHDDREFIKMLHATLSRRYGIELVPRENAQDAISMLQILPVSLIVCKDKIEIEPTAFKVCNYLQNQSLDSDVITLGNKSTGLKKEIALPVTINFEKLIHKIAFLVGKESNDWPEKSQVEVSARIAKNEVTTVFQVPKSLSPEYTPFHLKYFMHLSSNSIINFNVYSKIYKKNGIEYNLKVKTGATLSRDHIYLLTMRTGKEIYVKREDFDSANEYFNRPILDKFQADNLTTHDRLQLNSDCYEILLNCFKHSKIDFFTIEIIKEMVKSMSLMTKPSDALSEFLLIVSASQISYGYAHVHFTCLLVLSTIESFSWSKKNSKNKVIYFSLFHDLCLQNEGLIKLHHNLKSDRSKFGENEIQLILNHADHCANILESIIKAPQELTSLIREHHGASTGKDIQNIQSDSISPLSKAFIVCEDFVTQYFARLESRTDLNNTNEIKSILANLRESHKKTIYKDISKEIYSMFIKQSE